MSKSDVKAKMLDYKSVEGQFYRLYADAVTSCIDKVMERINGKSDKTVEDIVLETIMEVNDISNADFQDNFNPYHREEQPF